MGRGPTPIEFLSSRLATALALLETVAEEGLTDDHRATISLFLTEMRMGVGSEAAE